jgi:hypothetical protein
LNHQQYDLLIVLFLDLSFLQGDLLRKEVRLFRILSDIIGSVKAPTSALGSMLNVAPEIKEPTGVVVASLLVKNTADLFCIAFVDGT